MLEIKNLHVSLEDKPILKGLNLTVRSGEIHALMGPNGAGKSTLAKVLAGHPSCKILEGDIYFEGASIIELEPEERAHLGLFTSFQYPPEIPGITFAQFLQESLNSVSRARKAELLSNEAFSIFLEEKMRFVEMHGSFKDRALNEGFSGGEKKRGEILQMAVLEPKLSILDETDSGLDIDALRMVACGVKRLMTPSKGLILITHYQRLLDYIQPHYVHIFMDGKIVKTGEATLAHTLESKGYDWIKNGS